MKTFINTICITIILLSFNKISIAQIEDHYRWFAGSIYIPIIVNHQGVWDTKNFEKKETDIPDKQINIGFSMKHEDMLVKDNVFSGNILTRGAALDELIMFTGKVAEDKQMMEYIEITKDQIQYLTGKREIIEKKVKLSARFENIPIWMSKSYRFKYGVTKITSVKYNEEYYRPYSGGIQTHTESFVKINEDKITEQTTNCVSAFFKPGEQVELAIEDVNKMIVDCSLTMESRVYAIGDIVRVKAQVKEDLIENMYVSLLPKNLPLEAKSFAKYNVNRKVKIIFEEFLYLLNDIPGDYSIVLYSFNTDTKELHVYDQQHLTVLMKDEHAASIKLSSTQNTFSKSEEIHIIYESAHEKKVKETNYVVVLLPNKTEFIADFLEESRVKKEEVKWTKRDDLYFTAPDNKKEYKFLLINKKHKKPVGIIQFQVK